jgi:hypothetical protein
LRGHHFSVNIRSSEVLDSIFGFSSTFIITTDLSSIIIQSLFLYEWKYHNLYSKEVLSMLSRSEFVQCFGVEGFIGLLKKRSIDLDYNVLLSDILSVIKLVKYGNIEVHSKKEMMVKDLSRGLVFFMSLDYLDIIIITNQRKGFQGEVHVSDNDEDLFQWIYRNFYERGKKVSILKKVFYYYGFNLRCVDLNGEIGFNIRCVDLNGEIEEVRYQYDLLFENNEECYQQLCRKESITMQLSVSVIIYQFFNNKMDKMLINVLVHLFQ